MSTHLGARINTAVRRTPCKKALRPPDFIPGSKGLVRLPVQNVHKLFSGDGLIFI